MDGRVLIAFCQFLLEDSLTKVHFFGHGTGTTRLLMKDHNFSFRAKDLA